LIGLVVAAFPAAQSASLRDSVLAKAKEIYGGAAPSTITFITLPEDQLKPGSARAGGDGRGSSTASSGKDSLGGRAVQTRATQPGDAGSGVVVNEGGNQLYLDASPCDGKIMTFTNPYTKTELPTSVTCGGKEHKRYKLVQK
jgi:hypothetical protein